MNLEAEAVRTMDIHDRDSENIKIYDMTTEKVDLLSRCKNPGKLETVSTRYYTHEMNEISPSDNTTTVKTPKTNSGGVKNIYVLGCAFMMVNTAFISLQSLQSTWNAQNGRGVTSLSCVYGGTVLSCIIAPLVIKHVGTKWSIVSGFGVFAVYVAVHFYPKHMILIPASVVLGIFLGPVWIGQATYLATTAFVHAMDLKKSYANTLTRFNGIFWCVFQLSHIWGNFLSVVMLQNEETLSMNMRNNLTMRPYLCGVDDCGRHESDIDIAILPDNSVNMLLSVYLGCAMMGMLITMALLETAESTTEYSWQSSKASSLSMMCATLRILIDPRVHLLMPLVTFTGLAQGFIFSDFTKSYVNCEIGVHNIGFVLMTYGAVTAMSAFVIGHMTKHIRRYAMMIAGTLFNYGLLLTLRIWNPDGEDILMFYVISGCFGLCDAIWWTQSNTLFAIMFPDRQEAAFAAYRIFQSLGFAASFGYSYWLCVGTKLYILGAVLMVSLVLYSVVELRLRRSSCHFHHDNENSKIPEVSL
ncbi:protein unc-93 homolog A-like [Tubulanus polymorphus]|uniref:protein unc-93 homolog A-like n=1 Tax=Tubulanus polymorphus TaxID=672921 RepID=UPI003DA42872